MTTKLDALALDSLFRTARTRNGWTDRPVTEEQLRELYVDQEFFADARIKSNFICSIGYGPDQNLFPRLPRLTFEEAGRLA